MEADTFAYRTVNYSFISQNNSDIFAAFKMHVFYEFHVASPYSLGCMESDTCQIFCAYCPSQHARNSFSASMDWGVSEVRPPT